ncbi:MAG: hypothetical protein M3Z32_02225, partial [Acidobacteriota bacterium]|nr:hypothetical protein [Acidobacteriota bacterium]
MATKSIRALLLITLTLTLGGIVLLGALATWQNDNVPRFLCFVALALLSTSMRIAVPGVTASISIAFLFTLIGIEELALPQAIWMCAATTIVDWIWHADQDAKPTQIIFKVANTS